MLSGQIFKASAQCQLFQNVVGQQRAFKKNMVQRIVAWIGDPELNVSPTCSHELADCACGVEKPPPKGIHFCIQEKPPDREAQSDYDDYGDY